LVCLLDETGAMEAENDVGLSSVLHGDQLP